MRELDVLLLHYLENFYQSGSDSEKQGFRELLSFEDPVLFGYVIGRDEPEHENQRKLVVKIREGLREPGR
jgi:succinate dehydrogenase flavin-adding protein (antitoxin of CptAB toxin-antitoxin module)